jgi:hypothetical protein
MNYDVAMMAMMPRLLEFLEEQPAFHAYIAKLRALDMSDDAIAQQLTRLTVKALRNVTTPKQ